MRFATVVSYSFWIICTKEMACSVGNKLTNNFRLSVL